MYEQKILIASAHSIVRHGLKLMLNAATHHTVVGDSRPLRQMTGMIEAHSPNIVIADVCGQPDELELLLPLFSTAGKRRKLVLLTDLPEADPRMGGVLGVAAGVIASRGDAMEVLHIVGRVAEGKPGNAILPMTELPEAAPSPEEAGNASRHAAHITPREQQIMELIRQGCCNKRIARALEISVTTVRTHRQKLMAKLGLHNAVEIARYAASSSMGFSAQDSSYTTAGGRSN